MTVERLKQLREFFAGVPDEKVRMDLWGLDFNPDGDNATYSCMTAGCLWGWAAAYKPFRELGIRWDPKNTISPRYDDHDTPDEGFAAFFGITADDACWLIYPSNYPYPEESIPKDAILKRLDEVIQKYSPRSSA